MLETPTAPNRKMRETQVISTSPGIDPGPLEMGEWAPSAVLRPPPFCVILSSIMWPTTFDGIGRGASIISAEPSYRPGQVFG